MEKSFRNFLFAVILTLLTSCAAVEQIPGPDAAVTTLKVFTAEIGAGTKTAADISTGKVRWEAGDEISILDGVSNVRVVIGADDISADGRRAVFSAEVAQSDEYAAVYPYSPGNGCDPDGIYHTAGPSSEQSGRFADAHIAVAYSADAGGNFSFHNITGVLHFSISNPDIARICFRGAAHERISGPACFLVDETDFVTEWSGDGGTVINARPDGSGDCCIGTLETEFTKGFSIACYDSKGRLCGTVTTGRSLSLDAGRIIRLGSLDARIAGVSDPVSGFPYSESFAYGQGGFSIRDVKLPPRSVTDHVWAWTEDYGMKASSYIRKAYEAESWLVSPYIDLTSAESAVLSFDHAANKFYGDDPSESLHVMASRDGDDWVELDVPGWPSGEDWDFVGSGNVSLARFVGDKVRIAFVYTATTDVCGTWEIENFKVAEGEAGKPEPPDPDEGLVFYATAVYGIYRFSDGCAVKAYEEYAEQFGTGASSFFVANPVSRKYFRLRDIPAVLSQGDRFNVRVDGNIGGSPSGSIPVTVGKIDGSTAWLYSDNGIGFIIKR